MVFNGGAPGSCTSLSRPVNSVNYRVVGFGAFLIMNVVAEGSHQVWIRGIRVITHSLENAIWPGGGAWRRAGQGVVARTGKH